MSLNPYPIIGKSIPLAQTVQRNVWLLGKGDEVEGLVFRVEVQDMQARDERGNPIPPVVVLSCPRCRRGLRIDGIQKRVMVEYFERPKRIDLRPQGIGIVEQTGVLSVGEAMGCSHVGSDAPCGFRFRIQENVLSRIG
jgi:hypothetical protein